METEAKEPKHIFITHFDTLEVKEGGALAKGETMEVSDGYHTIDELYDHRITLFIALCASMRLHTDAEIWRSKEHSDGSSFDGWYILGIGSEKGKQITYHIPIGRWDESSFAITRDRAPEWDGHSPADVLTRLKSL